MSTPADHPMAWTLQVGVIVGHRLRSSQYPTNPLPDLAWKSALDHSEYNQDLWDRRY